MGSFGFILDDSQKDVKWRGEYKEQAGTGEKAETDTSNPYKTELDRIPGIANTNFY